MIEKTCRPEIVDIAPALANSLLAVAWWFGWFAWVLGAWVLGAWALGAWALCAWRFVKKPPLSVPCFRSCFLARLPPSWQ
jgi:hypothetical protein